MIRKLPILFLFSIFLTKSYSQIAKGNWLVGGSGSFTIFKVVDEKSRYLQLSPNIGYFLLDKLVFGLKPSYVYDKRGFSTFSSEKKGFYFGPFARYYFLSSEKPFNILLEGAYQHGLENVRSSGSPITKYSLNSFSFAGGPVIYFNTSVGLEFLFGYMQSHYTNEDFSRSQIQIGIGLQVHLEKE